MRDKRRKGQIALIAIVTFLTIFNILPTIFFYRQPLREAIDHNRAEEVVSQITQRVNGLRDQAFDWLESFAKLLNVKAKFQASDAHERLIVGQFESAEDADRFRRLLPRAGALIPFTPSQINLAGLSEDPKIVVLARQVGAALPEQGGVFQFTPLFDQGHLAPLAHQVYVDRVAAILSSLTGRSTAAELLMGAKGGKDPESQLSVSMALAHEMIQAESIAEPALRERILGRMFRGFPQSPSESLQELWKESLSLIQTALRADADKETWVTQGLKSQEELLRRAMSINQQRAQLLNRAPAALEMDRIVSLLSSQKNIRADEVQTVSIAGRNSIFEKAILNWGQGTLQLVPYQDLKSKELARYLVTEAALVQRQTDEEVHQAGEGIEVRLYDLSGATAALVLSLDRAAEQQFQSVESALREFWTPQHPELATGLPIWVASPQDPLQNGEKPVGIALVSPLLAGSQLQGTRHESCYVVAKGFRSLINKYRSTPDLPEAKALQQDLKALRMTLQSLGYVEASAGSLAALNKELSQDLVFEDPHAFAQTLAATREAFKVRGSKRYALLQFSDVEQRLLTLNRIETAQHEDLLKWRDEYRAARVSMDPVQRFSVPAPTENVYWSNLKLSAKKYLRGDDRKILRWGLDLSGGKTVRLELRDATGSTVTNPADIKQGMDELRQRVNRMGVSETTIRQEGNTIAIDFPGLQSLSAAELVQGSSMYFHIVNEQFSGPLSPYRDSVQQFLQDVWNEAVVTNRRDAPSINAIARSMLGQGLEDQVGLVAHSPAAQALMQAGLVIADPEEPLKNNVSESHSMVAIYRGDGPADWMGQTHPLVLVFRHYALEGSALEQVHASYDQSKGNFLAFQVSSKGSDLTGEKFNPADAFFAWTSEFAQEKVVGTTRATPTAGRGWRMAVILNGTVISSPALESPLRDRAMITGSFSQREVNRLVADLKAGSLTFTPHILSEANVSPELGAEERWSGVFSTLLALGAVVAAMLLYYRFAGLVASVALVVNLFIMWAVLQNIQATLTLAGLAGVVLTLGMAVDANVLVFERLREEIRSGAKLSAALHASYKKSFSAILDSNVTTVIAGLVLLNFDSGPLKGFALTLIIGVASSMFTALFMTRVFFEGWLRRTSHAKLTMMQALTEPKLNFMKWGRTAMIASAALIIAGLGLLVPQRHTVFGMDFTGGFSLKLELQAAAPGSPRLLAIQALERAGLASGDFQVRELDQPDQLLLQLGTSLEEPGRAFAGLPVSLPASSGPAFRSNPRISWVVDSLQQSGVTLKPTSLEHLDQNWSIMSGQYSDTVRRNAVASLLVAVAGILIYLSLRFQWRYAIASVVCLAHDLLVTVAICSVLSFLGVPLRIDMQMVAALMTILGYSLNDTIIIFDRIREDARKGSRLGFVALCNEALNATLSRTIMTSGTTLLVVLILLLFGGPAIFNFSLPLFIGIIAGTVSSWVVATPVLAWLEKKGHPVLVAQLH
jgi:SecD/SecF fusion protein